MDASAEVAWEVCGCWSEGKGSDADDPARAAGPSETMIKMTNDAYRLSK